MVEPVIILKNLATSGQYRFNVSSRVKTIGKNNDDMTVCHCLSEDVGSRLEKFTKSFFP